MLKYMLELYSSLLGRAMFEGVSFFCPLLLTSTLIIPNTVVAFIYLFFFLIAAVAVVIIPCHI